MTTIDVDTSPLQAAREWRGIGLVAAAMSSGLPMAQAEALEEGNPEAFNSIDEMIASAVVYGASIGIGRDEAVALLDRTVCRTGATVDLPDSPAPAPSFTGAVQERSARIADRSVVTTPLIAAQDGELDSHPVLDPIIDEPVAPAALLPDVPSGPSPQQAVDASGEIHMDAAFGPGAPWERESHAGELETWADEFSDDDDAGAAVRPRAASSLFARAGGGVHAAAERIVGTDRADAAADWMHATAGRVSDVTRDGRERLRRSEHATLFVAIGGGAVLIALLVALGGALGGGDAAGPGPADRAAVGAPAVAETAPKIAAAEAKAAAPAAPVKAMIPPARLTIDIFNAGSKKGYAKEVAAKLGTVGYKIGTVTNAKSSYSSAVIIHPKDMAREAKLIARRTGIGTLQVAPGSTRKITLVVT